MNESIQEVVLFIEELESDSTIPKNVKAKLLELNKELKKTSNENLSLIINKSLSNLDDISSDVNLDSFTRQQIWGITSMLESIDLN